MNRCWLALVDQAPDATASAATWKLDGRPGGLLAAWNRSAKPVRPARRVDPRIIDPEGGSALVSLVLPPPGVKVLFDDLAVQQARREILGRGTQSSVSTLLSDASHYEGSLLVARGPDAPRLIAQDPFARIFPAVQLRVDDGLLGETLPPAGPTIERYGSDQPWPWDRFL